MLKKRKDLGEYFPIIESEEGSTIFSSKDLCLINEIPEIFDLKIDCLKIEGRLKSDYYVAAIVHVYRKAIDDYIDNPENFDSKRYLKEIEKLRTRELTTFYFHDRDNQEIQDYGGRQYNEEYEYAAKSIERTKDNFTLVEIKNKLCVGDDLEVLIPEELEGKSFKIEEMLDVETNKNIQEINPGKKGQQVYLKTPFNIEEGLVIRRKL